MTLPKLPGGPPPGQLPKLAPAVPPPFIGLRWIARYVLRSVALDTTQFGDIPLPANGLHAVIEVIAQDTSVNTVSSYVNMQIAIAGGSIDTGNNYRWVDWQTNQNPLGNNQAGQVDISWKAALAAGGGTGAGIFSRSTIQLPFYNDPAKAGNAFWDGIQFDSTNVSRHAGAGVHTGSPITKVRFSANLNNLAAGTTFDVMAVL